MSNRRPLFELHLTVVLLGFTGLFAKLIEQDAAVLVSGRALIASAALFLWFAATRQRLRLPLDRTFAWLLLSGVILAGHHYAFFYAIQVSSVAIGVLGFATFPLFVTLLEPLFFGERLRRVDAATAACVFAGVYIVSPLHQFADSDTIGLLWGILSGLVYALLALLNRRLTRTVHYPVVTFYQQLLEGLCLLPFVSLVSLSLDAREWWLLLTLGVLFTALPQVLYLKAFRRLRAQLVSIVISLEPVYSIVLAFFILGEVPSSNALAGGALIIGSILLATRAHRNLMPAGPGSPPVEGR